MMGTEIVPETSCFISILTLLIAREDFITSCRRASFKSQVSIKFGCASFISFLKKEQYIPLGQCCSNFFCAPLEEPLKLLFISRGTSSYENERARACVCVCVCVYYLKISNCWTNILPIFRGTFIIFGGISK